MPTAKRRGRRPGETKTRDAILAAARATFSELGYDRATIRAIAGAADVDPALVMHYFRTKAEVFAAAMELPFDGPAAIAALLDGDRDAIGEGLARLFFEIWEDPVSGPAMIGLLRSASSHDAAATRFRELLDTGGILRPLATGLDLPDARLRAELASAHLIGIGHARYVLRFEPLASMDPETLIRAVSPALQGYLADTELFNKR